MWRDFFSEPRGITTIDNGQQIGVDTTVYTTDEIVRHKGHKRADDFLE